MPPPTVVTRQGGRSPIQRHRQPLWQLHAQTYAGRCSGDDDVARQERHELADVADESGHIKNHFARGNALPIDTVELQLHSQVLRVRNLITGRQEWPLSAALQLKRALGVIVVQSIAS